MSVSIPSDTTPSSAASVVPAEARRPQDHRSPRPVGDARTFAFNYAGVEHTFTRPTDEVLSVGFIRTHRRDQADMMFTLLEQLASPETLKVIDDMPHADFGALQEAFGQHVEAIMGGGLGN